jgi:hypothetical protein
MGARIGFVGPDKGMSVRQKAALTELVTSITFDEFHHSDEIGAASSAHIILYDLKLSGKVHLHPTNDPRCRFFSSGCSVIYAPKPVRQSYRSIVESCDCLIVAAPFMRFPLKSEIGRAVEYARDLQLQIIFMDL